MSGGLPRWDEVKELDSSHVIGLHLHGHTLNDDEAVDYARSIILAEEIGYDYDAGHSTVTIEAPQRIWVRKIPTPDEYGMSGWMRYEYQNFAARGASPVILIDFAHGWRYRCDMSGCENHYVKGGGRTGFPVQNFIDPPADRQDERYVYLCKRHASDFSARLDEEMEARMAAYYAERAATS